jgi:hypothetical protein
VRPKIKRRAMDKTRTHNERRAMAELERTRERERESDEKKINKQRIVLTI